MDNGLPPVSSQNPAALPPKKSHWVFWLMMALSTLPLWAVLAGFIYCGMLTESQQGARASALGTVVIFSIIPAAVLTGLLMLLTIIGRLIAYYFSRRAEGPKERNAGE